MHLPLGNFEAPFRFVLSQASGAPAAPATRSQRLGWKCEPWMDGNVSLKVLPRARPFVICVFGLSNIMGAACVLLRGTLALRVAVPPIYAAVSCRGQHAAPMWGSRRLRLFHLFGTSLSCICEAAMNTFISSLVHQRDSTLLRRLPLLRCGHASNALLPAGGASLGGLLCMCCYMFYLIPLPLRTNAVSVPLVRCVGAYGV